jgi:hypothetical protein
VRDHVLYSAEHPPSLHLTLESPRPGSAYGRRTDEQRCAAVLDEHLRGGEPLTDLVVSTTTRHHGNLDQIVEVLSARRPRISRLLLGALTFPDFARGDYIPEDLDRDGSCWMLELRNLTNLLSALPGLEELAVQANQIDAGYGPLASPGLRRLVLRAESLSPDFLAALGQSAFPALETLELWPGDCAFGWGGEPEALVPLLSAAGLPSLRCFTLYSDLGDGQIPLLAEAGILPRLSRLDLSFGTLSDAGAEALCKCWGRFAHLERLSLAGNFLTREAAMELAKLSPRVIKIGWQRWTEYTPRCAIPPVSLFTGWS